MIEKLFEYSQTNLHNLAKIPNDLLIFTDLFGNPLAQDYDYRSYVIYYVSSVELLDRQGNGILAEKFKSFFYESCSDEAL